MSDAHTPEPESAARWQPLEKLQRRVVGVLVEKAKTTPENYPLSLKSLLNGCNQKSNRFPQMQLEEAQVEESLEELRTLGAVLLIQGDGRVDKYRHLLYEWLGVDKVELAVMAELLLRGAQTLGELRGRAARMEPIQGVAQLQPIVESLCEKGLVHRLTPPGRGCVVAHALYQEHELVKLRAECAEIPAERPKREPSSPAGGELQALRDEVAALREQLDAVRQEFGTAIAQLRGDLGGVAQIPAMDIPVASVAKSQSDGVNPPK